MILFQHLPSALLFLAALALTALGAARRSGLTYVGGLLWAIAAICALVDGAPLPEILVTLLALLCAMRLGEGGAKNK